MNKDYHTLARLCHIEVNVQFIVKEASKFILSNMCLGLYSFFPARRFQKKKTSDGNLYLVGQDVYPFLEGIFQSLSLILKHLLYLMQGFIR